MAENPEFLNSLVTHNHLSANDDASQALLRQLRTHNDANENKTVLDKMVEVVWHKDEKTLDDLRTMQAKVEEQRKSGGDAAVAKMSGEIKGAVSADQSAMQSQNSVEFYSTGFLKAVPLFAGKNKALMAASIGLNALDAVKMKDSGGEVAADLALGGLKGFALKKTFDVLGPKQLSLGAEGSTLARASNIAGIGMKGVAIGGLSRAYDTGLNRENWVNANGDIAPGQAVSAAARAAFDGRAMALDATLFIGAHGAFSGISRVAARATEASPLLQKIESSAAGSFVKDSKMLPGATMGATFGFSSGAVGEFMRERQSGEELDLSKILKRGTFQGISDAAAGATGAGLTRLGQVNFENRTAADGQANRKMGLAFAGEDKLVSDDDTTAKPAPVEAPHVPPPGHEYGRVEAAPENAGGSPLEKAILADVQPAAAAHEMQVDAALKPILERSVNLAHEAVKPGATPEDVVNFFKHTAGDGQHIRSEMSEVAAQAKTLGNPAMESLIKHAYEVTPETAATLDTGLRLAELASRHGVTPEQDLAFLDYAYGEGRGAEAPLRIAAELSGNASLDHRIQEAYAGAHQLQRETPPPSRLNLSTMPPEAAKLLVQVLGHLPDNAASHQLFRNNLSTWVDYFPDHTDPLRQYASETKYGVVAAVVDGKLGTNNLAKFPDRSLTGGDLLGKLRAFESHRAAGDEGEPQASEQQPHQQQEFDLDTPTVPHAQHEQAAEVPREQVAPPEPVVQAPVDAGQAPSPAAPEQLARAANPYEPAISHTSRGKSVNVESLFNEFESRDGQQKQTRAFFLSDFVREMSDEQFSKWYANGLEPANRADLPAGTTNFDLMRIPGLEVLQRPDVAAALSDPAHAAIDARTLKEFLSTPPVTEGGPPAWQTGYIVDRIDIGAQRQAMAQPEALEPGQEPAPVDVNKVVRESLPSWFVKSIRDRFSTYDRNSGQATYPDHFDNNLAQMLENQRYMDRQSPRFRESTPPSNTFQDRVAMLNKALEVQQTTTAPELIPQILKLGTGDQTAVRGILDKLDLTTNAPEYTQMLKVVVPRAENIQDVKTLLDAIYFGKKAESNAFKARKDGKSTDFADRDRDNNLALALTTAHVIVPPGDPASKTVQDIVSNIINGKIRDPRPDMPGGPGGPGGRGPGGAGGREFRQRPPRNESTVGGSAEAPVIPRTETGEDGSAIGDNYRQRPQRPTAARVARPENTAGAGDSDAAPKPIAPQVPATSEPAVQETARVVSAEAPPEPPPVVRESAPARQPDLSESSYGGDVDHGNRGGGRNNRGRERDYDGESGAFEAHAGKGKGREHRANGRRERGGGGSKRWQKHMEGDDDDY